MSITILQNKLKDALDECMDWGICLQIVSRCMCTSKVTNDFEIALTHATLLAGLRDLLALVNVQL